MDCLRCHGLMVQERFEDLRGDPQHISFHGWRCVCCGNVVDPVIIRHRTVGLSPVLSIQMAQSAAQRAPRYSFPEFGLETPAA
jgi:hypothetical protein